MNGPRYEELLDHRRSVSELYARARDTAIDAPGRCERFREDRDKLFRHHPRSALPQEARVGFEGLDYLPVEIPVGEKAYLGG